VLSEELAAGERVLLSTDDYVVVCPYASEVPYQLRILPREHRASFGRVPRSRLGLLAEVLRETLLRLDRALGAPPFNLALGTAPLGSEDEPYFHWHLDVLPRLTTPAGFELGSGMAINPVLPENAARELRAATGEPAASRAPGA
jgi:UDPglucose--hexose-1-phosphate uridylyltransferase